MAKNNKKNNWKIWKKSDYGGTLYYKRAIGELKEMESAKALCKILFSIYKHNMKLLDVGCGAGHYLRSFKKRLDKDIDYTGLDVTKAYIKLAKKAFGKKRKFLIGDIFALPFKDKSFDIVNCSNVILHLPPPPEKAISELIRVSKKYVVIRTVFGERNYLIKEVRKSQKDSALINKKGEPLSYNFFNMYTEQYFRKIIIDIDKRIKIKIIDDKNWKDFDNTRTGGGPTATKIINGKQVSGNLLLDWKFIILEKI